MDLVKHWLPSLELAMFFRLLILGTDSILLIFKSHSPPHCLEKNYSVYWVVKVHVGGKGFYLPVPYSSRQHQKNIFVAEKVKVIAHWREIHCTIEKIENIL